MLLGRAAVIEHRAIWEAHRVDLAQVLGALDWRLVANAEQEISDLNWLVTRRREGPPRGSWAAKLTDGSPVQQVVQPGDQTREVWRAIWTAIGVLEDTAGGMGVASRVLRDRGNAEREYWPNGDGDDFDWEREKEDAEQRRYDEMVREAEEEGR